MCHSWSIFTNWKNSWIPVQKFPSRCKSLRGKIFVSSSSHLWYIPRDIVYIHCCTIYSRTYVVFLIVAPFTLYHIIPRIRAVTLDTVGFFEFGIVCITMICAIFWGYVSGSSQTAEKRIFKFLHGIRWKIFYFSKKFILKFLI